MHALGLKLSDGLQMKRWFIQNNFSCEHLWLVSKNIISFLGHLIPHQIGRCSACVHWGLQKIFFLHYHAHVKLHLILETFGIKISD